MVSIFWEGITCWLDVNVKISSIDGLAAERIYVEDIYPSVDGGRFAVKRIVGEPVDVWADIFRDGHSLLAADLVWKAEGNNQWHHVPMRLDANDRWTATFVPPRAGHYLYAIEAWTDVFGTWRKNFLAKEQAGLDVTVELAEGLQLFTELEGARRDGAPLLALSPQVERHALLSEETIAFARTALQDDLRRSPSFPLYADRARARAGAWYEMVPRSQGRIPGKHGTFDDCIARLPDIAGLGFDVVYLTPIHPIGHTNRKGRNNALKAGPDDPGSLYAIGAAEGGHDAVHPALGTLADFRRFLAVCRQLGLEVALDFATQCSLDHPWLNEHPEWFKRRPDGSIQYAENPPKKYEDIVNPDFSGRNAQALWTSWRDIVLFWVDQGVRIFRVDNPHTKPLPFWEWLIREVQSRDPEVIFLSEAFTRPKVMKALAKLGFTQSYTYFTWRTSKDELQAYLSEITRYPEREYFRPNFFTNTPDILPLHLQTGKPWVFKARVALAAMLSGNYGIYNGFELLEHLPIPGREEYLDSEKYEVKVRDWEKPGNIKNYISHLNRLRRANTALQQTSNLRFAQVDDGEVIGFIKESLAGDNAVAIAIALSTGPREFWFHFGELEIGAPGARRRVREIEDLTTGERRVIEWGGIRLRIDPAQDPALFFRCWS